MFTNHDYIPCVYEYQVVTLKFWWICLFVDTIQNLTVDKAKKATLEALNSTFKEFLGSHFIPVNKKVL